MFMSRAPVSGLTLVAAQRPIRALTSSRAPPSVICRPTRSNSAQGSSPSIMKLPRKRRQSTGRRVTRSMSVSDARLISETYFSRELVKFIPDASTSFCADSEEHTSELQSLMRISYDVSCLQQKTQSQHIIHRHH